jgi:hypothetical protein
MSLNQRSMIGGQQEVRGLFQDIRDLGALTKRAIRSACRVFRGGLVAILHTCVSFLFLV